MDNQLPEKTAEGSRKVLPWIISLVLLCFGFLLGYTIGAKYSDGSFEQGRTAGLKESKQLLVDSGFFPEQEIISLGGTITAIDSDMIEIETPQLFEKPLEPPTPETRKVKISKETLINQSTPVSETEYIVLMETFEKAVREWEKNIANEGAESDNHPDPPDQYKTEKIDFSKLVPGMNVVVTATDDIARLESFEATKIQVFAPEPEME